MCRVAVRWCNPASKLHCSLPASECQHWSDVRSSAIGIGYVCVSALRLQVVRKSVRPSVCLSVFCNLVDQDHIGWKSWKLIARTISPQHLSSSQPKGHPPVPRGTSGNFGETKGGVGKSGMLEHKNGNTRGVQKVLQLNMMHKWHKQNFYVIIQHNHQCICYIYQTAFWCQVWLRGLFDLVIIFEPCSCSTCCSNEHWIGIVVTPTLLNRPSTQCLRSISSSEEVVPRWPRDQAGHWVLNRIWTAGHHNSIWLA